MVTPPSIRRFRVPRLLWCLSGVFALALSSCAFVPQMEREHLSDPVMQLEPDPLEGSLDAHNTPRREGSAGGGAGTGGGCGC